MEEEPFWKRKALREMSREEWESLCDGCGKCCLLKLEDVDTGEIHTTNVVCRLMDMKTCRCTRYKERQRLVPDCIILNEENVHQLSWMPKTCAYRLLAEGKDLPPWHPLVTGDPASTARAGMSVKGRVLSERDAGDLAHHLVDWDV
jgi:uncharacterized cysteine cluster protein YcgN (CxxCxxCC family)